MINQQSNPDDRETKQVKESEYLNEMIPNAAASVARPVLSAREKEKGARACMDLHWPALGAFRSRPDGR